MTTGLPDDIIIYIFDILINHTDDNFKLLYYADYFGLNLVCKRFHKLINSARFLLYKSPEFYTNRIHRENRKNVLRIIKGDIIPVDNYLEITKYSEYKKELLIMCKGMSQYIKNINQIIG